MQDFFVVPILVLLLLISVLFLSILCSCLINWINRMLVTIGLRCRFSLSTKISKTITMLIIRIVVIALVPPLADSHRSKARLSFLSNFSIFPPSFTKASTFSAITFPISLSRFSRFSKDFSLIVSGLLSFRKPCPGT